MKIVGFEFPGLWQPPALQSSSASPLQHLSHPLSFLPSFTLLVFPLQLASATTAQPRVLERVRPRAPVTCGNEAVRSLCPTPARFLEPTPVPLLLFAFLGGLFLATCFHWNVVGFSDYRKFTSRQCQWDLTIKDSDSVTLLFVPLPVRREWRHLPILLLWNWIFSGRIKMQQSGLDMDDWRNKSTFHLLARFTAPALRRVRLCRLSWQCSVGLLV